MKNIISNLCPNCFSSGFSQRCNNCGYNALAHFENFFALLPGMMLKERYITGRTLGAGGFGITYLALDTINNSFCAIKEYLPTEIAIRDTRTFAIHSSNKNLDGVFKHGLKVFLNESSILKNFAGNSSIVQVMDCFEQNNTAYFVMEYLDGINLRALTKSFNGQLPYDLAFEILISVAGGLNNIHKKGLLHRDISPENIFATKSGQIKIIDFGATRYYVGERSRSLSIILKPGFAPLEQYSSRGNQGPWTDIYALAATFYYCVTGSVVMDALDRVNEKKAIDMSGVTKNVPINVCRVINKALELDYKKRYQNIDEFVNALKTNNAKTHPSVYNNGRSAIKNKPYISRLINNNISDKWVIPQNMNISIGRSVELNNIIIDFPNISREHCTIKFDDKKCCFYLIDLSSNGTFFSDNTRLIKNKVYTLNAGDEFYLFSRQYKLKVGVE